MISLGFCSTSDVNTLDKIGHHLHVCSTSAGRKDLSNDSQISVIDPMEPEICPKMFKKFSEKLGAKFPATAHGYSKVKISHFDDVFLEFFELEASPVEGSFV